MKKNVWALSALILAVAAIPGILWAANDVTINDTTVSIVLPGNSLSYTIDSSTTAASFTVDTNTINVTLDTNGRFEIYSANKSSFTLSSAGACTYTTTCEDASSSVKILCGSLSVTQNITITPGAASTCTNTTSQGGAPSSSGGGGSPSTPPAAPAAPEPLVDIPKEGKAIPFTVNKPQPITIGKGHHTVTLKSATSDGVQFTIQSDPVIIILSKGATKDLDLDSDGIKELRVAYDGLDTNGKAKITFTALYITAAPAPAPAASCPLPVKKAYKTKKSSAVFYVTEDCTRRPFSRSSVFFTYFSSWNEVQVIEEATMNSIAMHSLGFLPWGPKYDPKYGALVKITSDSKVYLLLGTERYWIEDEKVAIALYGAKWASWVEDVDTGILAKYTEGTVINYTDHHPNFTLVKYANSSKVYRLEPDPADSKKQVRRHIANEAAFKALKFRDDRIVLIADTEVYTDGAVLNGNAAEAPAQAAAPAPSAATGYTFVSDLNVGSSGDEVKQLQTKLKALGFLAADTEVTGYYGALTMEAVKAFQKSKGISETGSVGPQTRTALNAS